MTKYSFILLSGETEGFLKQLQELGVVDIKRSTKPVNEATSAKFERILSVSRCVSTLEGLDYSKDPDFEKIKEAAASCEIKGCKAQNTLSAFDRLAVLNDEMKAAQKELKDAEPWGEYDTAALEDLASKGLELHFHCVSVKSYNPEWEEQWPVQVVYEEKSKIWFVSVSRKGEEYDFPVAEISRPEASVAQIRERISKIADEQIALKGKLLCLKDSHLQHLKDGLRRKRAELDRQIASSEAKEAVEGYLTTIEGFAPASEQERLTEEFDKMGVFYVKEDAVEQDNPPIKLKNNRFSRLFECLTGMYGMPVYGEWDPTPVLSIFFFLFFAMCMGDAGYGLILIIYGILQDRKIVNIGMFDGLGKLISVLGVSTLVVGFFLGTAFGVDLTTVSWIPDCLKGLMLTGDITVGGSTYSIQMVLALLIGVFHICLAMTIKALLYTKRFGFKENISTWGWLLLILGSIITASLAMMGVLSESATKITVIAIGVISALGIYIFNKPGRNPLINIGAGLWDTYNMATGILGDVLSYIRLYALGLAGGMLGGAFNNLGAMVLGTDPTWHWLPYVLILLFGHILNLLMSCLGAFVHPLRLTFVEYFKNSGYEGKGLKYNPLKN
ncbi:MAG: V-type ATP synthase subunit I [Candidatus Cryptobacteroides sp.]